MARRASWTGNVRFRPDDLPARPDVMTSGRIHVFNVLFHPTGLNRLIGINMASLVNDDPAASDVLGRSALALDDSVRLAPDFPSQVAAVERWAAMMLEKREPDAAIERASRLLMAMRGCVRIDRLVRGSGLSASRFQRRFASEVGMTPKLFARTIRFDATIGAHHIAPDRSWAVIDHKIDRCQRLGRLQPLFSRADGERSV